MMNDGDIVSVYEEAASCLDLVASECKKETGVDLILMLDSSKRCGELVESLKLVDECTKRQPALQSLASMVEYFNEALTTKAQQIEQDSQSSGEQSCKGLEDTKGTSDSSGQGRRMAIEDTIILKGSMKFDDVAGLFDAKQALKEAIVMPLQYPQLFTGARKPWRRILLYGPPGTGKSRLAQAISAEIDSTFYCVSSSDLVSSWVGESEKLIKELFTHATSQSGRSVIFIDEIDSICRKRNSREEEHTRRIKTELLKQMEGADNSHKQDKIFLLCATNCPWELDSAFLRRFQKRIYIPLPERESRVSLIKIHCKDNPVNFTDQQWELLAERTEGYSGSDIANAVLEAMFLPIRLMQNAQYWKHVEGNKLVPCTGKEEGAFKATLADVPPDQVLPREVTLEDFLSSLSTHRHTVTDEELARFQHFTTDFGQNG